MCDLCRSSIKVSVRCRRMSDMDPYGYGPYGTPRSFGAVEIIGIVAAAAGLLVKLRTLLNLISDAKSDKKANVRMLVEQLQSIIREYEKLNKPTPRAVVEVLNRLEPEAQMLLKSVSSCVPRKMAEPEAQMLLKSVSSCVPRKMASAIARGSFDKRIGKLRTAITDIGNTLLPLASHVSPYQASPTVSQQHLASAPASSSIPAPGGTFIQVNIMNYQPCPIHFNMDPAAHAPGVMKGQIPPLGYPPVGYLQHMAIHRCDLTSDKGTDCKTRLQTPAAWLSVERARGGGMGCVRGLRSNQSIT